MDDSFSRARMSLLLDHPFFGSLILHLEPKPDVDAKRGIWVDGQTVGYNAATLDSMQLKESSGLLAKGVLHCAFRHQLRRGDRDQKVWQKACDLSINPLVLDSGLGLPAGALIDRQRFPDNTPEDIYQQLEQQGKDQQQPQGGGQGQGQPQPGSSQPGSGQPQPQLGQDQSKPEPQTGEVRDSPGDDEGHELAPADASEQEQEWKIKLQQAINNAQSRGDLPAGLKRMVEQALAPVVDWRSELRRFFQSLSRDDLSWSRPNRRFIGAGIYLPALHSERMGPMVLVNDTSGSTSRAQKVFLGEMKAVFEDVIPELIYYVQQDTKIQQITELEIGDSFPEEIHGGGGTDFRPAFKWIEEQGITPACMVFLTDLDGYFPEIAPDYPVLWASVARDVVPFGEVIKIDLTQERR